MNFYNATESRYDTMKYRRVGSSGLKLPLVSLGLWHNFGTHDEYENMVAMLTTAFDNGVTHFDLANNYGPIPGSAEENFGKILNSHFMPYRDELIISTKAGYTMWKGPYGDFGSRKYLLSSLDQSLRRMKINYVDIFYHHRMDKETPLEESMSALDSAVKSGKALYAGISNYDKPTTEKAVAILSDLKCPFVVNQVRYSILDRKIENELLNFAKNQKLGLIAFSPLAQGLLTNKYLTNIPLESRMQKSGVFLKPEHLTKEKLKSIISLNEVANKRGESLQQMALKWVLKDATVASVLIGASNKEQILENIKIAESEIKFTKEELLLIDHASMVALT